MPTTTPAAAAAAVPATMTAAVARRYGPAPDELVAIEVVPVPSPGRGTVLVQVAASSLNALDWHFATGTPYFIRLVGGLTRPKHPVRGGDVAGTIVAIGAGVRDLAVGDRVFGECLHGGFAPYATVRASRVALVPDGVTDEDAAATPVAGLTAYQAVHTHGAVQPGERVLVNGAAGGVGTFAVQLAVAAGAEVTAVCSTRNVALVRALGATAVLDYTVDDFTIGGERFDVMVDNVGNRSAAECIGVLVPGGRYVAVSGEKENRWVGPLADLARRGRALRRSGRRFHRFTASTNRDDLRTIGELLAAGRVVPAIDRVVGLDGVADGLAEIGTGHARAKIVVRPD